MMAVREMTSNAMTSFSVLDFGNIYTSVLASALSTTGMIVKIMSPVIEGVANAPCMEWSVSNGYLYQPIHVSLAEARSHGLETGQPSLHRSVMSLVAQQAGVDWAAIPEELRIVKTDQGWKIAKTKSLRLWHDEFGLSSHLMWDDEMARCYLDYPLIRELCNGNLPGKRSNRSSDAKVWGEFFPVEVPQYDYRLALKPLWEHYSGELMLKNADNISQILLPLEHFDESPDT